MKPNFFIIKLKDNQNIEKIPLNNNSLKADIKITKYIYNYKTLFQLLFKNAIYILFFISYLLYYNSLEKCFKGVDECPREINWIKTKIKELIFSCLIMLVLIELIIYKKISRFHLIHIALSFILFYSYSHDLNFQDHGYFNFVGFFILFANFFIAFLPINILIYLIQKKKKKIILFLYIAILIFSLILISFLYKRYTTDCNEWPKGLNNTFIENNSKKYGCQIIFPKSCPYNVFNNFLDITKLMGKNCKKFYVDAKHKILK